MKKLLPEPQALAITRNEASVKIYIDDSGDLWLTFYTPKGQMSFNAAPNFDWKNDQMGIAADFFRRIKEGDKLCDGCRFRDAVTSAVERRQKEIVE